MVEYVPDMHIVERSSRSVRILANWCSGSTPDSDSGDIGPIPVLAVKNIKKRNKNDFKYMWKNRYSAVFYTMAVKKV